jgi:hypothetical protein
MSQSREVMKTAPNFVFLKGGGTLPSIGRELSGRLAVNGAGCLYLESVQDVLIVWPPEASSNAAGSIIRTPQSGPLRVGDKLVLSGTPFQSLGTRYVGGVPVPAACADMVAIFVDKGGVKKQ